MFKMSDKWNIPIQKAREVAQQLRQITSLPGDPSFVLSTTTGSLQVPIFHPQGSNTLMSI